MFLLVLAHPGCSVQNQESCKMIVVVIFSLVSFKFVICLLNIDTCHLLMSVQLCIVD